MLTGLPVSRPRSRVANGGPSRLSSPERSVNVARMKAIVPSDLRQRLERARLDNRALFRALDSVFMTGPPFSMELVNQLGHLDADCAEALWALEQPPAKLDVAAMVRDTLASLERLPAARAKLREAVPPAQRDAVRAAEAEIREGLPAALAYDQVPGRNARVPPRRPAPGPPPARSAAPRVGRNDPCPCGSGRKYKKCHLDRPMPGASKGQVTFEAGSYGGQGSYFPSIIAWKDADGARECQFVLVNQTEILDDAEEATEVATSDLDGAFEGGGDPSRVAVALREAGYVRVDDARMAVD